MTQLEIESLEDEIAFAEENLSAIKSQMDAGVIYARYKGKRTNQKYEDEYIRLSSWMNDAISRLDKLRASRKVTDFFGREVEVAPEVIIRDRFKTEKWKDGSEWKVVRDEKGRFIKRLKA